MFSKLATYFAINRWCKVCLVTAGLTYITFKTTNIHIFVRKVFIWLVKKHNRPFIVVSTPADANYAVQQLRRRLGEKKILGLDCEWVSVKGKRRPVALLQLASPDGFCSLIRLCALSPVPKELVDLLEDKSILKVGVAVVIDARYLLSDYGLRTQGCLDLQYLASEVGVQARGLASLAQELFGLKLNKDWHIRCSDWEAEDLSAQQKQYAVEDAWIAVEIFHELNHRTICKRYSVWKRLFWNKQDYWHNSHALWSQYVGINFKNHSHCKRNEEKPRGGGHREKSPNIIIKRNYNTLLQKSHYSNTFLLAPDNQILSTISESKAAWYIEKNLVDIVCEDPKTLRLKFEPSNRAKESNGYYTKVKENRCVVCASETDLRRKNVVPVEYRRYFKDVLKNHHSHDVLLLCVLCHTRSTMHDRSLRDSLVVECDAPLAEGKNSKVREEPDLKAVRSAARALFNNGDLIPAQRKAQLKAIILDSLGISSDQLTWDLLEELSDIDYCIPSDQYEPHGQKVVRHYEALGGVENLERRWRQHFLDTMSPRYLPDLWSVDYQRD